MEFKKITAIIRTSAVDDVVERLAELGIRGISVSKVKGCGEYANLLRPDKMTPHIKIEIFAEGPKVDEIASEIIETANRGIEGDGIVAVLPVEKLYRIRSKSEITSSES